MHKKDVCLVCKGTGGAGAPVTSPGGYGAMPTGGYGGMSPIAFGAPAKPPVMCVLCNGDGGLSQFDKPVRKGGPHYKGPCNRCGGEGTTTLTVICPKCKGMGNWDTWNKPCYAYNVHVKSPCPPCSGKGATYM
eukprot:TRINITY_DN12045_c0_g1_i1.p1 TRINITY_DN12045_c0_g1~~TRINITY_DN12045_c0_g1_i1.p1  ORF type:complete len:133 (-),score=5.29 TRINITY_DN12045_c0_g1_i1:60-458(-)